MTLLITIGLLAASPPANTLSGKVVKIAGGDTLTMLVGRTQIKVRLDGIDTPERAQPFDRQAGQVASRGALGGAFLTRCQGNHSTRGCLQVLRE